MYPHIGTTSHVSTSDALPHLYIHNKPVPLRVSPELGWLKSNQAQTQQLHSHIFTQELRARKTQPRTGEHPQNIHILQEQQAPPQAPFTTGVYRSPPSVATPRYGDDGLEFELAALRC